MCHQTRFSCKRISSSEDILESHNLNIWSFTVTLTLKKANQSLWKTIWLRMMHHHTKFGSRRFSHSENIIWTNIHWHKIWNFAVPLTLDLNITIQFPHETLWFMIKYYYHETKFGSKRISSSEDIVETKVLIRWALAVTLTLKTTNLCMTFQFMMMLYSSKFGNKCVV